MEVVGQRGGGVFAIRDGEVFAPVNITSASLGIWGPLQVLEKWGYWRPFEGTPEQEQEILEAVRRLIGSRQ